MTITVNKNEVTVTPTTTTVNVTVAAAPSVVTLTAGVQGPQGVPGNINWKGTYAAGTPYVHDDGVIYNGSSFVCLVACTGVTPVEGVNWSMIAAAADDWTILDLGSFA
jgi:hypothetical protein